MMHGLLLFAHLVGVIIWIGGMFFAAVCLHPSLAPLAGKDRVGLMSGTLGRFLNYVIIAIVLIWVSGIGMIAAVGGRGMPIGWHLMIGIGVVMTLIFAYLFVRLFRPALRAIGQGDLAAVPALFARIRTLVLVNLALGVAAIAGVTMLV